MPRRARIHFVSLRSSLVNLPISVYGPLLERGVRPQGLAVHLTQVSSTKQAANGTPASSSSRREAYVGWTGMASASSLAHFQQSNSGDRGLETIEIDPQFAEGLGFAADDVVEIGLLYDMGYATSVATEPLTADDWEILELHASHVESTLLSQVRVAVVGQEIDVWVLGRTRVRLRVVSLDPSVGKALLLTTSTEVSIAPKTRGSLKTPTASIPLSKAGQGQAANGLDGTTKSINEEEEARNKQNARILRALPTRLLPRYIPSCSSVDDGSLAAIGFVTKYLLNQISGQVPTAVPKHWIAKVKRVVPPADPSQEQKDAPSAAQTPPAPKVLVPSDPKAPKTNGDGDGDNEEQAPKNEILIAWSPDVPVPDDHIILHGSVASIEDWDLVRVDFERESTETITQEPEPENSIEPVSRPKLAGVNDIIYQCKAFCVTTYMVHYSERRVIGTPGLLVTGRAGSGKTSILNAVAKSLQEDPRTYSYIVYADLAKYSETPVSKVKAMFKYWFDKAFWHRPSIIVMDNIDKLMGPELEHADSFRTRHITELFLTVYGSSCRFAAPNSRAIVLLASAESGASIHPLLNQTHVFKETVNLKPPAKVARKEILSHVVQSHLDVSNLNVDPNNALNLTALATQTEGYSATDLKDLVARAVHRAATRAAENEHDAEYQVYLTPEDFIKAQVDFVPLSLRDVKLQKSETVWADIGGLKETKRVLRETLEWPTKYGPIFKQSPLRLRSGLLLYGYPGCGKTLLASAVAKECGLNFISVKGPEILNKYIGASEQSVRELFERASAAKPCVLFFDEFDSIAPKRGHDSTGVTDRVVNQMLTQMDGAEGLDGVYVLAATSRPDLIDSALLRPGRLDKSLLCNMPDVEERKEILEAVSQKVQLASSVELQEFAEATEGYSGADLQALIYNAQLEVIHETIAATSASTEKADGSKTEEENPIQYIQLGDPEKGKQVKSRAEEGAFQRRLQRIVESQKTAGKAEAQREAAKTQERHEITSAHVQKVLQTMRPSVPAEERARLGKIYRAFVSDRSGELPVPPDAGGIGHRVTLG